MTTALYNQIKLICLQKQKYNSKADKRILLALAYMYLIQNLITNYSELSHTDIQRLTDIYDYLYKIIQ